MLALALHTGRPRRGPRRATFARRAFGVLLVLAAVPASALWAQSGTQVVENRAYLTYQAQDGTARQDSASASVVVQYTAGVTLAPPRSITARPGDRVVLAHTLGNGGTGEDAFTLAATAPAGWGATVYADADGDGLLGAGDPVVVGPVPLAPGASAALLLVVDVPATAPDGAVIDVQLRATSAIDATVSATVVDQVTVVVPPAVLGLAKTAGVLEVAVGEAVPYALVIRNNGTAPLADIVIRDRLPLGMQYAPTGLAGADSARAAGRDLRLYVAGPLAPGEERTIRYAAVLVSPGRASALANLAVAEAAGGERSDTAVATVRVRRGFALEGRVLIGKVWLDLDGDGRQGPGERGVGGARVWSADGEVVTTDVEGRFSFRDLHPGTHAFRLDTLRLAPDFRLAAADEEMVVVRTDGWTTPRVTFRLVPREARGCNCPPALAGVALAGAGVVSPEAPHAAEHPPAAPPAPPTVAALRTEEARAAEEGNAFLAGPAVRLTSPADGTVFGTNRVYVGVRGEPGAPVRVYDGERVIAEARLRPDGVADFVAVELAPGPHRLRVWMRSSWGRERWDSAAVHRSGAPAAFELGEAPPALHVDGAEEVRVRARLLDGWGVPVADAPAVTAVVRGALLGGSDVDRSSLGEQRRVGIDGWLELVLRAEREVGPGELALSAGRARARVPLRVLPSVRPLIATGVGQVGVGASAGAFGAVVVQGALGREVSVRASFDSRRPDQAGDFFGRGYDPLDAARYPTIGDASSREVMAGSTQRLSARVERGFDWLELGDVQTAGLVGGGRFGGFGRSLSGVSGRVATGAVVWQGYGSVTRQALEQRQLRGDGSSGPYLLGPGARPGTERVAIEVRARDNAARVISRTELARFTDYQIDYATGAVLLWRPVPATDAYGNPVFVVAALERRDGGESHLVGGLRAATDVGRWLPAGTVDSLALGVSAARGEGAVGLTTAPARSDMLGADLHLARGGLALGGEVMQARTLDSAAVAFGADARWTTGGDRLVLDAGWTRVGEGFASSFDPRLGSGLSELRAGAELRLSEHTRFSLRQQGQWFDQFGVSRHSTTARAEERIAGRPTTQTVDLITGSQTGLGGTTSSTAVVGKVTMAVSPRFDVWAEGSHALGSSPAAPPLLPDQAGAGFSYEAFTGVRAEASHKQMRLAGDSVSYAVTSFGVRAQSLFGGQVWGGLERAGAVRASHAAVLGWNQRLAVAKGWSFHSTLERRFGLSRASLADPTRALPFPQLEPDRWSAGAGVEWMPGSDRSRLRMSAETHDATDRRSSRIELSGDLSLGSGAALLTLHDWSQQQREVDRTFGRQDRSLLGIALRPATLDALNALFKVEWRRTLNPPAGAVLGAGGLDERLIAAADAVWEPAAHAELAGRYAMRWSSAAPAADAPAVDVRAHYFGARGHQDIVGPLRLRFDARALLEESSGASAWSVAPSLALRLGAQVQLEAGYRFGPLSDRDFAADGGPGMFATLGVRFTEAAARLPAAFWRERVAHDR